MKITEVWDSAFIRSPVETVSESAEAVALGLAPAPAPEAPAKVPVPAEPRPPEAVPARWGRWGGFQPGVVVIYMNLSFSQSTMIEFWLVGVDVCLHLNAKMLT